jgi:hypothetical protein
MQACRTPERARYAPSLTPQTGQEALAYRSFRPIPPSMQAPTAVACTPTTGLFALQGPGRPRHKEWKWMSISAKRINGMPFSPFLPETEAGGGEPFVVHPLSSHSLTSGGFFAAIGSVIPTLRALLVKPLLPRHPSQNPQLSVAEQHSPKLQCVTSCSIS